MIEHHVYFWLKEERRNEASMVEFRAALESLLSIASVVRGMVGTPAPVSPRPVVDDSYQFALSVTFESLAAHDAYQTDPAHVAFLDGYRDWWSQVRIYDLA